MNQPDLMTFICNAAWNTVELNIMKQKALFEIAGSFVSEKYGLIIYGDVVAGTVKKGDYILFVYDKKRWKLNISYIGKLEYRRTSKTGLLFSYESELEKTFFAGSTIAEQASEIVAL